MPGERLSMRKIRELLRLRWEQHLSQRVIGRSLRLSQAAVSEYLSRARRADLTWPLPDDLDDARLEALLFPPAPNLPTEQRPVPDWAVVHRELRRPNVTLALLWEEYRAGRAPGRIRLLLVLRPVSRVGRPAEADAAPRAHRRSGSSLTSPVTPWR